MPRKKKKNKNRDNNNSNQSPQQQPPQHVNAKSFDNIKEEEFPHYRGGRNRQLLSLPPPPSAAAAAAYSTTPCPDDYILKVLPPPPPPSDTTTPNSTSWGYNKNQPILHINPNDANLLQLNSNDSVLIIHCNNDDNVIMESKDVSELKKNEGKVPFAALCTVKITNPSLNNNNNTIQKKNKKSNVNVGEVRLGPASLYQRLVQSSTPTSVEKEEAQTPKKLQVQRTPTSTPLQYKSPSKSKFSFAKGGGGGGGGGDDDALLSPFSISSSTSSPASSSVKKTHTPPPPSSSSSKAKSIYVQLIPTSTTKLFSPLLYNNNNNATRLILTPSTVIHNDNTIANNNSSSSNASTTTTTTPLVNNSNNTLKEQIVKAMCQNVYIQTNDVLSISFAGKMEYYRVVHVVHDDDTNSHNLDDDDGRGGDDVKHGNKMYESKMDCNNDKEEKINDDVDGAAIDAMSKLSLSNDANIISKDEKGRNKDDLFSLLQLYKIDYNTKITFISQSSPSSTTTDISPTMEKQKSHPAPPPPPPKPTKFVAGLDNTIQQIKTILHPTLHCPHLFPSQGPLRPPRGLLLHGPNGVGKSCLVKQLIHDLTTSSTSSSSSSTQKVEVQTITCTEIQSSLSIIGQAEKILLRIFNTAEAKCSKGRSTLLIMDDVHLICPRRGSGNTGADRVVGTLLALMDGIGGPNDNNDNDRKKEEMKVKRGNVAILATTTNPSLLDSAIRRSGRLDTEIEVPIPNDEDRREILKFQLDSLVSMSLSSSSSVLAETMDESLERRNDNAAAAEEEEAADGNVIKLEPALQDKRVLSDLARKAKGFTGADCYLCVKEALRMAALRSSAAELVNETLKNKATTVELKLDDLKRAIRTTKPSTIQSVSVEVPSVPWASIGGMEEVKLLLREAIELPLTHPQLFSALCVPPPRGVLLYGPPGCSKTLMARALATEGNMNFLAVKGPELLSKWLGESERALASLFRRARMASPCVIFFDEIDAIASKRGSGEGGSSGGERLLSQLLTELDGVGTPGGVSVASGSSSSRRNPRVVVVGATNRPDLLDNALTRPGRIDRMIYVGLPDEKSREGIFEISLKGKACHSDIDVPKLASNEMTGGYSGAELVAICREAAMYAIQEDDEKFSDAGCPKISMVHLLRSIEGMKRQISPEMLEFYASFRDKTTKLSV